MRLHLQEPSLEGAPLGGLTSFPQLVLAAHLLGECNSGMCSPVACLWTIREAAPKIEKSVISWAALPGGQRPASVGGNFAS